MSDQVIEQAIQEAGANVAPRITPDDIEANIASQWYFTAQEGVLGGLAADGVPPSIYEKANAAPAPLALLTFCVLVLRNGFTVTGESACASPENFNAEIGRKVARTNAIAKVWPLMGYQLKEQLHQRTQPPTNPEPPAHKTYTWGDVARHVANRMSMTDEIEYFIEMRDGAHFTGNVKPSNYSAWQGLAIAHINRQAAA